MTGDTGQVCADLTPWLPILAALITEPDSDGTVSRSKPSSRPPWNPAVANVVYDVHAAVRAVESRLRVAVTGTILVRGGSDANTLKAIDAIPALAIAVDDELAQEATRTLNRLLTTILQLPAVDLEERPQRLQAACPFCQRPMLRLYARDGRLTCLAYGSCFDADGRHPVGHMTIGAVSGEPFIAWADGTIQLPEGLAA